MDNSTLKFVKQLTKLDKKTLTQKALKLAEECGEVAKSVLPFEQAHGTMHRFVHQDAIAENCSDVLLVALSMLYSLGYDDVDIAEIMQRKSLYWSSLQDNESEIDVNALPHEIHVTVANVNSLDSFKNICRQVGVKPIVLDLHTKAEGSIIDIMTSSVFVGSTVNAILEAEKIKTFLEDFYEVVRCKIEVPPFHPAVPSEKNTAQHVVDGYFETHMEVYVTKDPLTSTSYDLLVDLLADNPELHVSKNYFKNNEESSTVMVTYRKYSGKIERFKNEVSAWRNYIEQNGFTLNGKTIIEYSIYDTKVTHDSQWISGDTLPQIMENYCVMPMTPPTGEIFKFKSDGDTNEQ